MLILTGKNVVVIGGSRGVGRRVVEAAARNGARVLAVAREASSLKQLEQAVPDAQILAVDAADEGAASKVFAHLQPDILVLCAGAFPPTAPMHKLRWAEFAVNWESDVKISFHFIKEVLTRPLPRGTTVVLISSGAALAGSPNSGGYAGAKRTQLFMANYAQKESDRLGLGIRFVSLAPRIMPDSDLGKHAIAGYADYLGISPADFVRSMDAPPSASDVAAGVLAIAGAPEEYKGKAFIVSGKGLQAAP